ncbi:MFS transporter [Gordonia polyisoprenivorans]|uniref:MFS transporter n=1 Tax=Gordonia polyisoprenivorans TaxID=84595 RepID=A0A846WQM1_9ACTN|nr:MFS transporter [Gordonia polyisoprenivorans]NKY03904.1 MFS transporter [Gordonia polyisoprenivorans]
MPGFAVIRQGRSEHTGDAPLTAGTRHRFSLFLLFLVQGIALSSWVTRTPDVRDAVHASTAQMGLILFGLSIGSMVSVLSAGPLVARFGTRSVAVNGTCCIAVSMPVVALGTAVHLGALVALGLCFYGLGIGSVEVALNVDGAQVEKDTGKPVLAALHGFFSLGTVLGASVGIAFTSWRFPVTWHLLLVGLLVGAGLLVAARFIPGGTGIRRRAAQQSDSQTSESLSSMTRDVRLVLIGVIVLAMALAEGTANDWLPLIMVDEHGFDASWGSASYAVFAAGMTVGRFAGNRVLAYATRAIVLAISAVFGGLGLLVVMVADNQTMVVVAIILWGLGASLGFPVTLSAAGASGRDSTARVSVVSTIGYIAFLAGPPVIGVLGEHFGLRTALALPLVLVMIALVLTPSVRDRRELPAHSDDQRTVVTN